MHAHLQHRLQKALSSFPHVFDQRLSRGLERLLANTPSDFLHTRSSAHVTTLLLAQFFLQRRIEERLAQGRREKNLFCIKLFQSSSRICCGLTFLSSFQLTHEQLLNIFHTLLPSVQEVPFSFFTWFHPECSYQFCYFELEKMRGKGLSKQELRSVEKAFTEQFLALPPLTPTLFWPYNEEESFRQIQFMLREIQTPSELPHISIQFQEQTLSSLEFLVHYVRPKTRLYLENSLKRLSQSFHLFWRFKKFLSLPLPIELGAFSITVPSSLFDTRGSINLLYARRYIAKNLENIFGPFRDYNGGLFEKQQYQFEWIRIHLSDKIPLFDLFAEKVFYALHPVELRIALSLIDAEQLFMAFSDILQAKESHVVLQRDKRVTIVRNGRCTELALTARDHGEKNRAHAHIHLGSDEYCCCFNQASTSLPLRKKRKTAPKKLKTLRLSFQEGPPPSLNPHLASGDMRCRLLSKLLFDGLMRLNADGIPQLAGAVDVSFSPDHTRYLFTLRPSFWSNGEKVTAIDYVASWQRALMDHVSHPEQLFIIKNGVLCKERGYDKKEFGIHAIDASTLEILLERPDPHFLHKLTKPIFFPLFGSMREPKWFNGPYLIREQTKEGIWLERNPYYWDTQQIFFEQIEIKWANHSMDTIYKSFCEGSTDWIGEPISALSPPLLDALEKQGQLLSKKVDRRFLLHFNTRLPALSSPSLRHALSLATDRSYICQSIFPHSIPEVHPAPSDVCLETLFKEGLREQGFTRETYPSLNCTYSHQAGREQLALYLQEVWKEKLGISIHLEKNDWNLFRNKLEKGAFDITMTIHEALEHSPLEFSERVEGASSWNFSRWEHPPYRSWIKKARDTEDQSKKQEYLSQAEAILQKEVPFTPLFRCAHLFSHSPRLQNYFFDTEGGIDFSHAYLK